MDKVAASGGYLMAAVADRILAAPFAVIVGVFALWDLKRRPHLLGKGRAIFGIVAGVLGIIWGAWIITM